MECSTHGSTMGIPLRRSSCKDERSWQVVGFKDVDKDDTNSLMEAVAKGPVSIAIEADKGAFQYSGQGFGLARAFCSTQVQFRTELDKSSIIEQNGYGHT